MKEIINKLLKSLDNKDVLKKEVDSHFEKLDLPIDTQIKIALNAFSSEQLNDIKDRYKLNEYHWNIIGLSYRKIGNYEMAEQSYLNAIELKPAYEEPYGNLMSLYIQLENWESYKEIYKKGIQNASSNSFLIYQDGRYQYYIGNFEMSYNAALSVLEQEKKPNESAFVLGIKSLLQLAQTRKIEDKGKYFAEASLLLDRAIYLIPNSIDLIKIKESQYLLK